MICSWCVDESVYLLDSGILLSVVRISGIGSIFFQSVLFFLTWVTIDHQICTIFYTANKKKVKGTENAGRMGRK